MFSVYVGDELPRKLVSPVYQAVMMCAPGVRVESVNCATPLVTGAVPRRAEVEVSKKETVPVGDPRFDMTTVADNVKGCPYGNVLTLLPSVKFVCAWLTVSVTAAEVLAKKFASPLYVAVIWCVPTLGAGMKK